MLVDVGTEDRIGLSDAHFDIVRERQGSIQCVCMHCQHARGNFRLTLMLGVYFRGPEKRASRG